MAVGGEGDLGKISLQITAIDNASATLQQINKQVGRINTSTKTTTEEAGRLSKAFGSLKSTFVTGLTLGIAFQAINAGISAITGSIQQAFESSIKWEAQMWRIETVTGELTNQMIEFNGVTQTLEAQLKAIGDRSFFGRAESTSAFLEFAKQGFSATESLQALEAAQALAIVGLTDMKTAIHITAVTLHAFNLEASEAWRVTDTLAKAANISALDVEDFGTALGYAGAFARQAGYSLEDTAATLAVLSNQGLQASKAGVYFRQAIIQMSSPTAQATETLSKLGVTFQTASGQFKDLDVIVGELNKSFEDMGYSDFQKTQAVIDLFGARASTAILMLMNNTEQLNDALHDMEGAGGTAQQALEKYADTAEGTIKKLQARTEGTLQDAGTAVNTFIAAEIRGFQSLTDPIFATRESAEEAAESIREEYTRLGIDANLWAKETSALTDQLTYLYATTRAGKVSLNEFGATMELLESDTVSLEEKLAVLQETLGKDEGLGLQAAYQQILTSLKNQSDIITGNFDGLIKQSNDLADNLDYIGKAGKYGELFDERSLKILDGIIADTYIYAAALEEILEQPDLVSAFVDRGGTEEELKATLKLYRDYNTQVNEIFTTTARGSAEQSKEISALSDEFSQKIIENTKKIKEDVGALDILPNPEEFYTALGLMDDYLDDFDDFANISEKEYDLLGLDREQEQLNYLLNTYEQLVRLRASGALTKELEIKLQTEFGEDIFGEIEGQIDSLQRRVEGREFILGAKIDIAEPSQSDLEDSFKKVVNTTGLIDKTLFLRRLDIPISDLKQRARDIAEETGQDWENAFKELKLEAVMEKMKNGFEDATLAEQAFADNLSGLEKIYAQLNDVAKENVSITIGGFSAEELGLTEEDIQSLKDIQESARLDELQNVKESFYQGLATFDESGDVSQAYEAMGLASQDATSTTQDALQKLEDSGVELIDYMSEDFQEGWATVWQGAINITEEAMGLIVQGMNDSINEVIGGLNQLISEYNSIAGTLGLEKLGGLSGINLNPIEFGELDIERTIRVEGTIDDAGGRVIAEIVSDNQAQETVLR